MNWNPILGRILTIIKDLAFPEIPEYATVLVPLEYYTKLFSFDVMDIIHHTNLQYPKTFQSIDINSTEFTDSISIILIIGVIDLPKIIDLQLHE